MLHDLGLAAHLVGQPAQRRHALSAPVLLGLVDNRGKSRPPQARVGFQRPASQCAHLSGSSVFGQGRIPPDECRRELQRKSARVPRRGERFHQRRRDVVQLFGVREECR